MYSYEYASKPVCQVLDMRSCDCGEMYSCWNSGIGSQVAFRRSVINCDQSLNKDKLFIADSSSSSLAYVSLGFFSK